MNIGLLMVCGENDVLAETLAANCEFVDWFYALDGTQPNTLSEEIITAHPKCAWYGRDRDLLPERYGPQPRDGWRQSIYEVATYHHGYDHWFLLLHGDEIWTGVPDDTADHDGYLFKLPLFFPRAAEPWDYTRTPIEQLRWSLWPGYPEFRMFRGGPDVQYDPLQHHNVAPSGISRIGFCPHPIRHYLYRSPEAQRERAARHEQTRFDPGNYQHIVRDDAVFWTDEMISRYRQQTEYWADLVEAA